MTDTEIEPQGDHEYLVRLDDAETRIQVTPDVLRRISAAVTDEPRVVDLTVQWLLERQSAADLPPMLDLDDIAAGYPDFVPDLDRRLAAAS
ncbi:hypothetical protein [Streptacidiphilus carbonis]|jgi:hypothetical protein|uniref:hypothetical protein n=1 Tax=Streptacidiphilus carbonis TaxID=105422 RepID=UPI0005AB551D|nr:hypothetical protein [Streptacidiphilus carbonis]